MPSSDQFEFAALRLNACKDTVAPTTELDTAEGETVITNCELVALVGDSYLLAKALHRTAAAQLDSAADSMRQAAELQAAREEEFERQRFERGNRRS